MSSKGVARTYRNQGLEGRVDDKGRREARIRRFGTRIPEPWLACQVDGNRVFGGMAYVGQWLNVDCVFKIQCSCFQKFGCQGKVSGSGGVGLYGGSLRSFQSTSLSSTNGLEGCLQ
jgi:hypothetical protein